MTSDPTDGTDSDTYGADDAITFAVVFNQTVTITGAPRLRFSITGPGDEYAAYVSGSGRSRALDQSRMNGTETFCSRRARVAVVSRLRVRGRACHSPPKRLGAALNVSRGLSPASRPAGCRCGSRRATR